MALWREHDPEDREASSDATDDDRLAQADPGTEGTADDRADRDRSPHDEAHHGVHASLESRRTNRLPVADLDDVVDDDREATEEHRGDEERHRRVARGC